jgi:hypothetical protein
MQTPKQAGATVCGTPKATAVTDSVGNTELQQHGMVNPEEGDQGGVGKWVRPSRPRGSSALGFVGVEKRAQKKGMAKISTFRLAAGRCSASQSHMPGSHQKENNTTNTEHIAAHLGCSCLQASMQQTDMLHSFDAMPERQPANAVSIPRQYSSCAEHSHMEAQVGP